MAQFKEQRNKYVQDMNNNNGYRPQGGQGWNQSRPPYQGGGNTFNSNFNSNQPSIKDLVLDQAKINESINKKLVANDKSLESLNLKVETLSSTLKNQLSFNKMIETQLAQIAAAVPVSDDGKILGQPETPIENVNMVSTGWGKLFRKTPHTNHAGKPKTNAWGGLTAAFHGDPGVPMIRCSIFDQQYDRALCDLGASINIIPKVIFEQLQYPALSPTMMYVQLADSLIRYPEGEIKNMLVRIKNSFFLADFVILDMEGDLGLQLNLGRPFLRDAKARIDVGIG